jgi:integrase
LWLIHNGLGKIHLSEKGRFGAFFRGFCTDSVPPTRVLADLPHDNWFFKTRRRLGLGKLIPYGYRHGLATDALANGVPDAQVAELLGHSGTAMLHKHYSHLTARTQVLQAALGRVRS